MKKHVPIIANDTEYRLRLSISAQRKLQKKYEKEGGPSALAICIAACDNPTIFADVLDVCLGWPESGNPRLGGDALYDELVDADMLTNTPDRTKMVIDILVSAGLVDDEHGDAIVEGAQYRRDNAVEKLLSHADEDEEEAANEENPQTP